MASQIRTTLDVIYLNIQARLVAVLAWPVNLVIIGDPDKIVIPEQEQFLTLWLGNGNFRRPVYGAAGRIDTRELIQLEVTLFTQTALDDANSAGTWLTDATGLGHLIARHNVFNAILEPWAPTDDQGNRLTTSPLKPSTGARPRINPQYKSRGDSKLLFEFEYMLALDQTLQ